MGIALSLKEINDYYEHFFSTKPTDEISFEDKMKMLIKEVGIEKLEERRFKDGQRNFQQVIPITTPESRGS